ncbi:MULTISPECIES: TonB-dependent receptor [Paraburkholderia]|uniref:TonB-dependent receptor domain-containing protein n=1 Tax=Paraburkholderia TaxID=1822464 RepID=UPI00224F6BA9|nr:MULTISPECIES: TonB-dependent receptor [Paraburkholderia]MCX4162041.1 TonB-dependent receptor [Paraburkholderia megapolitana]MDN7157538.1 TonB-dependent receptor [Paraburkholderia sp. CHISQ3]MDQ6494583.1 TonB-dependent receptor [Paraburkholderia megapolitana]
MASIIRKTAFFQKAFSRRVAGVAGISAALALSFGASIAQAADDSTSPPAPQSSSDTTTTLPNIVVTGDTQHLPQSFDQRYATTHVLTRQDLDRLSPADPSITQALATLPGVTVAQNGGPGATASVSIRGSSGAQVAVFIDGIRVGSATTGTAEWADLPASAFERVEVISGPAAASFGANAVGGVVQLFTRHSANQPNQTTISTGGGSNKTFDTQIRTSGSIPSTGPLAALAGLTYSLGLHDYNTAGIDTTQPYAYGHEAGRNPYHAQDIDGRLGYAHGDWSISTFALYHRSDLSYDNAGGDNRQLDHQLTTGVAFHWDIAPDTQFDQSVGYANDRQFYYTTNSPGISSDKIDSTRLSTSTSLTHQEKGFRLFGLPLSGETKLAYDFSREQAFLPVDIPTGVPTRNDSAVSLHQSATLGALTLFLAGRHEIVEGQSVNTGNVAVSYAITPVYTARLSYGNAFRLPTFNDLYYPQFGNPNLRPERSDSVEAALDAATSFGNFSLAIYNTRVHNLIAYNSATFAPDNIGEARIQGIDLSYKGTLGKSTPVSLAVGILNPQDITDRSWLNRRPRQTVNLSVDHTWDEFHLHALSTGVSVLYGGTTFDDQFNATYLPSYTRVDLRASYRVNSHLTVSANLSNLFNRQYVTAYGYNTLGRTAFGKVSYTF